MKGRLCFVTYELHPVNPGGCGVLLAAGLPHLLDAGFEVHLLVDMPRPEAEAFARQAGALLPVGWHVHHVDDLAPPNGRDPDAEQFGNIFLYKSHRFLRAVEALHRRAPLDLVELHEYCGPAYYTICQRRAAASTLPPVAVRIHGAMTLIDEAEGGRTPTWEREAMYAMERASLEGADVVFAPSEAVGEQYKTRFGLSAGRFIVSPPFPLQRLDAGERSAPNRAVFLGRLQSVKGADIFVDAAVRALREGCLPPGGFVLIGPDLPDPFSGESALDLLRRRIPSDLRAHIRFTGQQPWPGIRAELARALFAVVPSRFESFCLAAHEIAASGVPLVVSDIPAFRGVFEPDREAVFFDGSSADLARQLVRLASDGPFRESLARPRLYNPSLFVKAYAAALDRVRGKPAAVTRSAGLETVAVCLARENRAPAAAGDLGGPSRTLVWSRDDSATTGRVGPGVVGLVRAGDGIDPLLWHRALGLVAQGKRGIACALPAAGSSPAGLIPIELTPLRLLSEIDRMDEIRLFFLLPEARAVDEILGPMPHPLSLVWSALSAGETIHILPEPWIRPAARAPGAESDDAVPGSLRLRAELLAIAGAPGLRPHLLSAARVLLGSPGASESQALCRRLEALTEELGRIQSSRGWKAVLLLREVRGQTMRWLEQAAATNGTSSRFLSAAARRVGTAMRWVEHLRGRLGDRPH